MMTNKAFQISSVEPITNKAVLFDLIIPVHTMILYFLPHRKVRSLQIQNLLSWSTLATVSRTELLYVSFAVTFFIMQAIGGVVQCNKFKILFVIFILN